MVRHDGCPDPDGCSIPVAQAKDTIALLCPALAHCNSFHTASIPRSTLPSCREVTLLVTTAFILAQLTCTTSQLPEGLSSQRRKRQRWSNSLNTRYKARHPPLPSLPVQQRACDTFCTAGTAKAAWPDASGCRDSRAAGAAKVSHATRSHNGFVSCMNSVFLRPAGVWHRHSSSCRTDWLPRRLYEVRLA